MAEKNYRRTQLILREKMTEEAVAVAELVYDKMRKLAVGRALIDYDIAVLVREVVHDEGSYGNRAVEQTAKYTSFTGGDSALYRLMKLPAVFTRELIKFEAAEPMADGRFLQPEHFLALAQAPMSELQALLERVRAECLSPRQVANLIRERRAQRD